MVRCDLFAVFWVHLYSFPSGCAGCYSTSETSHSPWYWHSSLWEEGGNSLPRGPLPLSLLSVITLPIRLYYKFLIIKCDIRSSCCGAIGLAVSLQCWDTGLIPAWHSGLRIWSCCSWGWCVHHNCGWDLIPGLGTPYAAGWPKMKNECGINAFLRLTVSL